MEAFVNNGAACVVLKRKGGRALICRTNNNFEPFIVPGRHIEGNSYWDWGHYFKTIDEALDYFNRKVEEDENG